MPPRIMMADVALPYRRLDATPTPEDAYGPLLWLAALVVFCCGGCLAKCLCSPRLTEEDRHIAAEARRREHDAEGRNKGEMTTPVG